MPTMCIEMPAVSDMIHSNLWSSHRLSTLPHKLVETPHVLPRAAAARCQVPSQTERIGCQLIKGVVDYDDSRRLGMCSVMPESLLSSAELLSLIKTSATCGICCTSLDWLLSPSLMTGQEFTEISGIFSLKVNLLSIEADENTKILMVIKILKEMNILMK